VTSVPWIDRKLQANQGPGYRYENLPPLPARRTLKVFINPVQEAAMAIMARSRRDDHDLLTDVVKGAVAGLFATWVMGYATTYLYEAENEQARQREDEARDGKTAYGVAAEKTAEILGRELSEEQRQQAGSAIHWALGIGTGAAYGALRHRVPGADAGNGLLFGTAFWAVVDEGANVALGLTPGPSAFPWQTHARGVAGHLVFGVAAETALRAMDRIA